MTRRSWLVSLWIVAWLAGSAAGQVTRRVSVTPDGTQGNGSSYGSARSISADARFAVFQTYARNLVAGDENLAPDILVSDRLTGRIERVSVATDGTPANAACFSPSISADGRFVVFHSLADILVTGDTNFAPDVFVRDRRDGRTERVSVTSHGSQATLGGLEASISANARYVAFESFSPDLVAGDTNGRYDVFLRDLRRASTERVSVADDESQADDGSNLASISADGRFVAFQSHATNLVTGDTNGVLDVFVRDRKTRKTLRASRATGGAQGNGSSGQPSISEDGRYVAFVSQASNLVDGDTNGVQDVFVRDLRGGTTERVSVGSAGEQGNGESGTLACALSADGRYVAFVSTADDLAPGDTNGASDVFVRDRWNGTTDRVSLSTRGEQGNLSSGIYGISISADGRYVVFESGATDLVPGDTNGAGDVFVRDRTYAPMTTVCAPGVDGVIPCPCSNPPGGPGRGCDNSSGTGGATLAATGVALLSADDLVFTTEGERPAAASVLLQGNELWSAGTVYGQGVGCAGGTLTLLFTKRANGGRIRAPDFAAGDPAVSARSANRGDALLPGDSRWYFVLYRDPVVLDGCPAGRTFNATPTGEVTWLP